MLYQICEPLREINVDQYDRAVLTAGYLHADELEKAYPVFGFSEATVQECRQAHPLFRSGVEVYEDYTFTQLRIAGKDAADDCVAVYIARNLLLVIDVEDHDGSTRGSFMTALQRLSPAKATTEKLLCLFLDTLLVGDVQRLEGMRAQVAAMEENMLRGEMDPGFNPTLLDLKKKLLKLHTYYDQILDVTETADENDNDVLDGEELIHISNLAKKVTRLREDTDSLTSALDHLQDAYSAALDLQLNHTMKIFTVITSVFFPLTIVVGWYGMNFQSMPEFTWRFGYLYVILLSVFVVAVLVLLGKRKKWF